MIQAAKATARAVLCRLVRWTCHHPRVVTAFFFCVTVLCLGYVVTSFTITTDTRDLIAHDLPYRQANRDLEQAFPQNRDQLLIVIESSDADRAVIAARTLSAEMRARPDLFADVNDLMDNPFFRRNGLLYLDLPDLEDQVDRLAAAQPMLGALHRDPSLRGLFELLTRIAERSGDAAALSREDIVRVFDAVAAVAEAQIRNEPGTMPWRRLMSADPAMDQLTRRFLSVVPVLDFTGLQPARAAIAAVRQWAEDLTASLDGDVTVRLTGEVALDDEELQSVAVGIGAAGGVSLVVVLGLLWIAFRSPRTTLAAIAALIVGLILTGAWGVAVVGAFNLISVAFAVLFIGLSVDFGIHFSLSFREIAEQGDANDGNLVTAASRVGGALTLAALAAAIGFLSFLPTDYVGLAELGIIAAGGMGIALLLTFTLLPALLMLVLPRLRHAVRWTSPWQTRLEQQVRRQRWPLCALAGALALGCAVIARDAYFDFDPLHLKDQESESVATLLDVMDADPTHGYAISVLAADLDSAVAKTAAIEALETVGSTRTLADFVPAEQDAKLDVIADLRLILAPSLAAIPVAAPTAEEVVASAVRLREALVVLAGGADERLARAADRLAAALGEILDRAAASPAPLEDLRTRLLGGLPAVFSDLTDSLAAAPFGPEDLPARLRDQWLAGDGRALLQIYPSQPVHRDRTLLAAFVTDVQTIVPEATGPPIGIYEGGRTVVTAFVEAAAIAVVAIAVMLLVVLRSLRDTLIVFAPLVLAALLTVAGSVLLGIPFNFANVVVLPLLFGLGVASSLHLVMRERAGERRPLTHSTLRAVLFSALTTIASFSSLCLSAHPGTASMGILLTVSIALVLACTLVFLPAFLEVLGRGHR